MDITAAEIEQRLALERTQVEALTDTAEQALAQHALQCKVAAMKGEKGAATELTKALRELTAYRKNRDDAQTPGSDGEYFGTPAQALPWLQRGFVINKSKFYKDVADGKVPRKNGVFRAEDLLFYARAVGLRQTTTPDKPEDTYTNAKEDVIRENIRKLKMANDEREGSLIARSLVEQELSARLAFLKRDLFNLGPRVVDTLMEHFSILAREQGLDLDSVNLLSLAPDLEAYWDKNMAAYLDSYARPRGFLPEDIGADQ